MLRVQFRQGVGIATREPTTWLSGRLEAEQVAGNLLRTGAHGIIFRHYVSLLLGDRCERRRAFSLPGYELLLCYSVGVIVCASSSALTSFHRGSLRRPVFTSGRPCLAA